MNILPTVRGYLECALWSSTDDDGEPLDAMFTVDDFSPDALERARADCGDFSDANRIDMGAYLRAYLGGLRRVTVPYRHRAAAFGHDFWLTRNGHGAGFWDRGFGGVGLRLSEAARVYGESHVYVGDDGQLHFM